MKDQQLDLWHESLSDALLAVVMAAGGPKKIGSEMWATMSPDDAGRKLSHCLNKDRAEKLTLDEVEFLLKKGREINVHTGMAYLSSRCGYDDPRPIEAEEKTARLQREFIEATKRLSAIGQQLGVSI